MCHDPGEGIDDIYGKGEGYASQDRGLENGCKPEDDDPPTPNAEHSGEQSGHQTGDRVTHERELPGAAFGSGNQVHPLQNEVEGTEHREYGEDE